MVEENECSWKTEAVREKLEKGKCTITELKCKNLAILYYIYQGTIHGFTIRHYSRIGDSKRNQYKLHLEQ